MRARLFLLAPVLALVAACGAPGQPNAQPTATGEIGTTTPTAVGTTPPAQTTPPQPTTQASPSGPRIVTFRVNTQPSCPAGTSAYPIAGRPVVLEWDTAGGVTGTTLSIDGPGLYGSYGPDDSVELFFGCDGAPNTNASHTYTLRTVGGGAVQSRTLTVSAWINEIPQV